MDRVINEWTEHKNHECKNIFHLKDNKVHLLSILASIQTVNLVGNTNLF